MDSSVGLSEFCGFLDVLPVFQTQVEGQFPESASSGHKPFEMPESAFPCVAVFLCEFPEKSQKISFQFRLVQKAELFVDYGLLPHSADRLGLCQSRRVMFPLKSGLGFVENVHAQRFHPDEFVRFRIADRWIIVELKRASPLRYGIGANFYFGAFHRK